MKKADAAKITPKAKGRVRTDEQGAAEGPDAVPVVPKSTTGQTASMKSPALAAGATKRIKGLR